MSAAMRGPDWAAASAVRRAFISPFGAKSVTISPLRLKIGESRALRQPIPGGFLVGNCPIMQDYPEQYSLVKISWARNLPELPSNLQ
jgi:hypothetical protein